MWSSKVLWLISAELISASPRDPFLALWFPDLLTLMNSCCRAEMNLRSPLSCSWLFGGAAASVMWRICCIQCTLVFGWSHRPVSNLFILHKWYGQEHDSSGCPAATTVNLQRREDSCLPPSAFLFCCLCRRIHYTFWRSSTTQVPLRTSNTVPTPPPAQTAARLKPLFQRSDAKFDFVVSLQSSQWTGNATNECFCFIKRKLLQKLNLHLCLVKSGTNGLTSFFYI